MIRTILVCGLFAVSAMAEAGHIDNYDGTVTDPVSGLTWMRCAYGQVWDAAKGTCNGNPLAVNWSTAMVAPQGLAGQFDWRLPNIRELYALVDYSRSGPAFDKSFFFGVADNSAFWSSTVAADSTSFALTLRFWFGGFDKYHNGLLDKAPAQAYARYVRGQETSRLMAVARPSGVYQADSDGSIEDKSTGLVWQPCLVGQTWTGTSCTGSASLFVFGATGAAASGDRFAGHSDWRVPTMVELLTLFDATRSKPALNTAVFKSAVTGNLWSGTVNAGDATEGWYLSLDYGDAHTVTGSVYQFPLRLVRGAGVHGPYTGTATIVRNPYGPITVVGATLNGNMVSDFAENAEIQFGAADDGSSPFAQIDFNGLSLGPNRSLKVSVGASGKAIVLRNTDNTVSEIGGIISATARDGQTSPALTVANSHGVLLDAPIPSVTEVPSITADGGLTLDALGATSYVGGTIVNGGIIDGGSALDLLAAAIHGGGAFFGDTTTIRTFGNANNPVNGKHYLDNGLHLFPNSGTNLDLVLNDYGQSPQFLNLKVHGSAFVSMPSNSSSATAPPNDSPVLPGTIRPAGSPEPSYGGGSIIVQATKDLTLLGDVSNDFVFPGGIVLKAGGTLNLAGVTINQGWTTTGKPFQGVYFEAPNITSPALTSIYSNDLNWINFSVMPIGHFRVWRLRLQSDGSAPFVAADNDAPHLNTYSVLIEAAANGLCWTCLVNTGAIGIQ